jgi:RND family efflux transporter MFP subunit
VKAYYEAPIYARTSGYVKSWRANIGMHVRHGELLAEIDAPELDQQLRQAEADLGAATANYELAKATNERWKGLVGTGAVSKQDADQKAGDAAARKAAMASANANLARLRELAAFKRVVAPFDGIVTQRNTDIGMLIGSGAGPALFQVSDTHRLRVYVSVPEPYAGLIHPGLAADVIFPEHPGKQYAAKIAFTAGALDPVSRTLQVELQVDNRQGELFPGAYAEVSFGLPAGSATLRLPINALMFRAGGLQVAVMGPDHRVIFRKILQGRDFGTEVEVLSGVGAEDEVVLNPPDSLSEGALVRIAAPRPARP